MIKIDLLKNHPSDIPALAHIWYEVLGKIWVPDVPVERVITRFAEHLNEQALPVTFIPRAVRRRHSWRRYKAHIALRRLIALDGNLPVGMCSLRDNDRIRPDLTPWLGSLVVDPKYQRQGIGRMLIDVTVLNAKELGYEKLYLFAFDPTIPKYYKRFGWRKIGIDEFKGHSVTVMEVEL